MPKGAAPDDSGAAPSVWLPSQLLRTPDPEESDALMRAGCSALCRRQIQHGSRQSPDPVSVT